MNRTFHDQLDGRQKCRRDPEAFFPNPGQHGAVKRAKNLCRACPFQPACLQYALTYAVQGIWGGTTQKERETYRGERGIKAASVALPARLVSGGPAGRPAQWRDDPEPITAEQAARNREVLAAAVGGRGYRTPRTTDE